VPVLAPSSSGSPRTSAPCQSLEKLRCCRCGRTIAKVSAGEILRPGAMLEIKCGACNGLSYLVGITDLTT
jgi:hypothetical protein